MSSIAKLLLVAACLALSLPTQGRAELRTVCTITVNSSDEAQAFKRALPSDRFRFVELVEPGRPDWLASACHTGVQCDILLISGHYNSEGVFFSDRVDGIEHLPIAELERVACSESCPGLLDRVQQVYLFGCNSLNNDALKRAGDEIARSLVRAGHSAADAARLQRVLAARLGESSRARMARIFKDVPVLYGFSGVAPLGPVAGAVLDRYFRSAGAAEVGTSRASGRLLAHFAEHAMVSARGITDADQEAAYRSDVCHFLDDRLSAARKAAFVHDVLRRDITEVRMHLDRIERFIEGLEGADGQSIDLTALLEAIASDASARERYLAFARDSDDPATGARMVSVAQRLGWLSETEQRAEWMRILDERLARGAGPADVDLACRLNSDGNLDGERHWLERASGSPAARRAMLACLGARDARVAVLASVSSSRGAELEIAEVLLHRRPVSEISEFRLLATEIARMEAPDSQARALNALARQPVPDRESVVVLADLFPLAKSLEVQRAIAGVLLRHGALDAERHRLDAGDGGSIGHAAMLACLGDTKARQAVLGALTAEHGGDGEIARVLLHHRPMTDAAEFRAVAAGIGRMTSPEDQARAIDTLAKHPPPEHGVVAALAGLFPYAKSLVVQRAIAGVLIRSDIAAIDGAKLAQSLREHRMKSPDGRDVIDVLIRRLATL